MSELPSFFDERRNEERIKNHLKVVDDFLNTEGDNQNILSEDDLIPP